jgi:hypothetical protein
MVIECRHILPKGTKCKSPALNGHVYCYFHDHLQRFVQDGQRAEREPLYLPSLEDARGIQMAISQILAALGSGRLEARQAGLYLYGLQLATQLLAQLPEPAPEEMVRNLTVDVDGSYIAADAVPCKPLIEGNHGSETRKLRPGKPLARKPRLEKPGLEKLTLDVRSAEPLPASEARPH